MLDYGPRCWRLLSLRSNRRGLAADLGLARRTTELVRGSAGSTGLRGRKGKCGMADRENGSRTRRRDGFSAPDEKRLGRAEKSTKNRPMARKRAASATEGPRNAPLVDQAFRPCGTDHSGAVWLLLGVPRRMGTTARINTPPACYPRGTTGITGIKRTHAQRGPHYALVSI